MFSGLVLVAQAFKLPHFDTSKNFNRHPFHIQFKNSHIGRHEQHKMSFDLPLLYITNSVALALQIGGQQCSYDHCNIFCFLRKLCRLQQRFFIVHREFLVKNRFFIDLRPINVNPIKRVCFVFHIR